MLVRIVVLNADSRSPLRSLSFTGSPSTAVSASPTSALFLLPTATSGSPTATRSTRRSRPRATTTRRASSHRRVLPCLLWCMPIADLLRALQSYESIDVLDSAVLIMPLCFFISANDPRFVSTLKHIKKSRDRGGLTENNCEFIQICFCRIMADERVYNPSGLPLRHGQGRRRHRWRR